MRADGGRAPHGVKNNPCMSLLSRLRRHFGINVVQVMERELGQAAASPFRGQDGIECRVLSEQETLAFATDPALELNAAWVRAAFAGGGVCLGAVHAGRLIAYTWLAYVDTQYAKRVWVRVGGAFRYSYKSFVRLEHRGRRIIQALHALADRPDLRGGRRYALNFVDAANPASFAALRRAGSRTIGYVGYAKCFGRLLAVRSPGVRRAGIWIYDPAPARIAARMRPCPSPESSA